MILIVNETIELARNNKTCSPLYPVIQCWFNFFSINQFLQWKSMFTFKSVNVFLFANPICITRNKTKKTNLLVNQSVEGIFRWIVIQIIKWRSFDGFFFLAYNCLPFGDKICNSWDSKVLLLIFKISCQK